MGRLGRLGLVIVIAAGCGSGKLSVPVGPRPDPVSVAPPDLGPAWPAPACTDEAVPVRDAKFEGGLGRVIVDGGKLYSRGDDDSTIEVAWGWGGPAAVLARGPQSRSVYDFTVGDGYVYWSIEAPKADGCFLALDGAIFRVPIGGGAIETVVAHAGAPADLAVVDGSLYYQDRGLCFKDLTKPTPKWIRRIDRNGDVETLVSDPDLDTVRIDGHELWFAVGEDLVRTDLDGTARTVVATVKDLVTYALAPGQIFVSLAPTLGGAAVGVLPRTGGAVVPLFVPFRGVFGLEVHGDTLYVQGGGEVLATPIAGGPIETVARGAALAGFDGDRVLVWTGGNRLTLDSLPAGTRVDELIAWSQDKPSAMAIDADAVYWVSVGAIMRRPLAGGAPVKLTVDDVGFADKLVLAGDKIVFADDGSTPGGVGRVGVLTKKSPTVTWIATDVDTPIAIAATATTAIIADGRGRITTVPLGGGAATEIAAGTGPFVMSIVTDGTTAFFARYGEREVYAVPIKGGAVRTVGEAADPPMALVVDGRDLVIATQFEGIQRVAAAGGTPRTIARTVDVPLHLALDADHVYWSSAAGIERVPRAGGHKQHIADGTGPFAVAAADVYWSDDDYIGTIRRAAKRPGSAVLEAKDPELGPLAVAGDTIFVGTRTDVRAVDLATGAFPVVIAPHRTPIWVGTTGTAVLSIHDDKLWAVDLAAARTHAAEVMAKPERSTDRERAFDTNFIDPVSKAPVTGVVRAIVAGNAVVWTTSTAVYRMHVDTGLVDTLASGLADAGWLAFDGTTVHVAAADGTRWSVYAIGKPGTAPTREATVDHAPHGLAVDAASIVVSTDDQVLRFARGGAAAPEVLAAHQRGAAGVVMRGRAVSWMTRDGILTTDGTGCGAHRISRWPSGSGLLPGNSLAATADGVAFTDVYDGVLATVR